MTATGTTTQQVNTGQLCDLLGVTSITVAGTATDPQRTIEADVAQATMDTVLTGYTYNPNYVLANATPDVQNAATLRQRAINALTTNQNYLAITTPTNAQAVAQVAVLTKECSGIIRLLLNQLDTTSGT